MAKLCYFKNLTIPFFSLIKKEDSLLFFALLIPKLPQLIYLCSKNDMELVFVCF